MLDSFRKASKSWLAKGLLGLLIVSFGAWGIGDFITGGGEETPAITVGETKVGTAALRAELNREVNALREQLGGSFTTEQAIEMGFLDRAIGRMVTDLTQLQTASAWGMVAPDAVVARAIKADPMFRTDGAFDRQRFEAILAANGMTEAAFADRVRREILQATLSAPVAASAHAPDRLVDALDRHRNEARRGRIVTLTVDDAPPPGATPDPAELETLYQDNIAAFTAPEYRALTAIVLGLEDARPLVSVGEEAVRAEYEARAEEYTTPETRVVSQVLVDEAETARQVSKAAQAGTPLAEAAAAAGAPAPVDMGDVTPTTLPSAQSQAVFALAEGAVSAPVESAFGWHVFQVRSVTPGGTAAFEDVREEVRADLIDRRAVDALYDLSVRLDDTLGGGATLEQAADALSLDLLQIDAVDRQGRGPDGTPVEGLPEAPAFLGTGFSAEPGEQTLLQETDTGYFVLRVDSVTPPAPRPLEEVRDRVAALWARQQQAAAIRSRAEAIFAAMGEGRTLDGAAELHGASVRDLPAVRRDGEPVSEGASPPPGPVVRALFAINPGDTRLVADGDAVHVVSLEAVDGADPSTSGTRDDTAAALQRSLADDLFIQFTDALSRQQGVEINRAVIDSAFR